MRVAVINLTAGGMSGGYRKYLHQILPRMAADSAVENILCAAPDSLNVRSWFANLCDVKFVDCEASGIFFRGQNSELFDHLEMFAPEVIFVPVERIFRFKNVPVVRMLQNMEPFVAGIQGNPITERIKLKIKYLTGKRAVMQSKRIIAISRFVRDFLVTRWSVSKDKISLIHHGIDVELIQDGQRPGAIPPGWDDQFIFTAGSIRPARGLEDLLSALEQLESQEPNAVKLVIAGKAESKGNAYQRILVKWIHQHNLSSKICWTGELTNPEMIWCYRNCRVFLMTSRVESFGMTGAEAMAHGCICIAADNPCLPELFGEAALYYPPGEHEILAGAIKTALSWDNHQRKAVSAKALERIAGFSWDVCAQKTVAALVQAAA